MRLFFRMMRGYFPNERKYRGKHRKPFPVNKLDEARLVREIQIEETNMFLLRHPYLTEEQSAHLEDFNPNYNLVKYMKDIKAEYQKRQNPDLRIEDHLSHLRHTDSWEK